jgi:hypothetical protein
MSDGIGAMLMILLIAAWLNEIGWFKPPQKSHVSEPLPKRPKDKLTRILDAYGIDSATRAVGGKWYRGFDADGNEVNTLSYPTKYGSLDMVMVWNGEEYEPNWTD